MTSIVAAQYPIPCLMHTQQQMIGIVAVLSWLAWDAVISFGDEVKYLWKHTGRWWSKAPYLFIRYVPIVHEGVSLVRFHKMEHTVASCRTWGVYSLTMLQVLTILVEVILVVRVYVMYNMNNTYRKVILGVFVSEIIIMIVLLPLTIPLQYYSQQCAYIHSPRLFMGYWICSLLFETFLFGLTLAKFLENRPTASVLRESGGRPVIYTLMRDGTWAFAAIFLSMLVGTLTFQLSETPQSGIGYDFVLGVLSFSGSHVILNIRRLLISSEESYADSATRTTSILKFWLKGATVDEATANEPSLV